MVSVIPYPWISKRLLPYPLHYPNLVRVIQSIIQSKAAFGLVLQSIIQSIIQTLDNGAHDVTAWSPTSKLQNAYPKHPIQTPNSIRLSKRLSNRLSNTSPKLQTLFQHPHPNSSPTHACVCLSVCVRLSVCIMHVCACVSAGHAGSSTIPTPVGRTVFFLTLKTTRLQDCSTGTDTLLRLLTIFFPEPGGLHTAQPRQQQQPQQQRRLWW